MPDVRFSRHALNDLDRIFDFLATSDPDAGRRAGAAIVGATKVLQQHPMIGRAVRRNVRELIISHGRYGYVALYRFLPHLARVDVLAIRHQREAGYS